MSIVLNCSFSLSSSTRSHVVLKRYQHMVGHRNSPAIYAKKLAFLIGIQMRGQAFLDLLNTVGSANFWPHFREENCDVLALD
jgi:hypothetical protein